MTAETPVSQIFHLARQDGVEMRSVMLSVTPSQVHIGATDQGPTALHIWGRDGEYEFWVDVKAKAFPALVFALLKEKYEGIAKPWISFSGKGAERIYRVAADEASDAKPEEEAPLRASSAIFCRRRCGEYRRSDLMIR